MKNSDKDDEGLDPFDIILDDTGLVGDIKGESIITPVDAQSFLKELERLMIEYRIHKIDIGWKIPDVIDDELV